MKQCITIASRCEVDKCREQPKSKCPHCGNDEEVFKIYINIYIFSIRIVYNEYTSIPLGHRYVFCKSIRTALNMISIAQSGMAYFLAHPLAHSLANVVH